MSSRNSLKKTKKKGFDLNKREFLKKGILAGAVGLSLIMFPKIPLLSARGIVTNAELKNYAEAVNAIGNAAATQDIDLTLGNVVTATITTGTTFTFSNPPESGKVGLFVLYLTNGGSQTVTWPISVFWPKNTKPILASSGVDVLSFITINGGSLWYGFLGGENFS